MKKRSWYIWAAKPKFQTKKEIVSFWFFYFLLKIKVIFIFKKQRGGLLRRDNRRTPIPPKENPSGAPKQRGRLSCGEGTSLNAIITFLTGLSNLEIPKDSRILPPINVTSATNIRTMWGVYSS